MRLYTEGDIKEIFARSCEQIKSSILGKSDDYILNVNETEFAEYLIQNHYIDFPILCFDEIYVDSKEKDIPAEWFPRTFHVYEGKKYKKNVIVYHIPYTGDIKILRNRAASRFSLSGGAEVGIENDSITIEIIDFFNDPERIKQEFESTKRYVLSDYNFLKEDCDGFNDGLLSFAISNINQRKQELLKKNNLLSSLGVPLKKKQGLAETFAVPKPELRKKIKIEPAVYDKGFHPEPTLSTDNYNEIVKIIYDVGKNFERMPSVYTSKGEEDLRDHILLTLDPNFEFGSASGETFNKKGKTDILLRYDSSVIYIAECKFWKGEKQLLSTIDQLLGYLTWRNSKASVIIFAKNKDFSTVISKITETVSSHSNYLRTLNSKGETWWNYKFHINNDRNRELDLSILAFHLPDYE
jgi:hypothetical protein